MIRTNDGNVVAVGSTSSYGPTSDVMVVKMTTCGDVIWSYSYDLGGNDIGRKVRETSDGLIVVGSTQSLADGNSDGFIMKINTLGGWNWTRALGVDEPGKEDDRGDQAEYEAPRREGPAAP